VHERPGTEHSFMKSGARTILRRVGSQIDMRAERVAHPCTWPYIAHKDIDFAWADNRKIYVAYASVSDLNMQCGMKKLLAPEFNWQSAGHC
jgi:hypothetical protein